MIPSVLQVALQCGSSGLPLGSLQAECEHCFTTAMLRCCFLLWHLASIQGCLFPSSYCLYHRSLFEQCFLAVTGRVLQRQIPYLVSPHCIHTLRIPSSKYGFVKLLCGLWCVSSDALPKSNLGFVTPLHALWRDVFNPLILMPQHLFTSEALGCWCGPQNWCFCPEMSSWCPE